MADPERQFRCDVCGHVDTYPMPRFSVVRPVHCGQRMRAGSAVGVGDRVADQRIDIVEDRRQPWRLDVDDWKRRVRIIDNHPAWEELYQVWQRRGGGRMWGSEFIGMIGRVGESWEYDSGAGVPSELRTGSAATKHLAVMAMVRNLSP